MDMDMPGMGQSKAAENKRLLKAIGELSAARLELEVDFLQRLSEILTKEQADALAAVLKPSAPGQDGLSALPLSLRQRMADDQWADAECTSIIEFSSRLVIGDVSSVDIISLVGSTSKFL